MEATQDVSGNQLIFFLASLYCYLTISGREKILTHYRNSFRKFTLIRKNTQINFIKNLLPYDYESRCQDWWLKQGIKIANRMDIIISEPKFELQTRIEPLEFKQKIDHIVKINNDIMKTEEYKKECFRRLDNKEAIYCAHLLNGDWSRINWINEGFVKKITFLVDKLLLEKGKNRHVDYIRRKNIKLKADFC